MTTYQTREDVSTMTNLTGESLPPVQGIFEELAILGYNFFQWSSFSQPMNRPGTRKRFFVEHPEYETLPDKEQLRLLRTWSENEKDWYFIEAFGKQFLRGEGETFYDCALQLLEKAKTISGCTEHEWAYTHSNGHKTCQRCQRFEPCTVEETLANYEKGSVELDEHKVLEFNHKEAMCACGSHKRYFLEDSIMPDKYYKCVSCGTFLQEEEASPLIPESFEDLIRQFYAFDTDSLLSEEQWRRIVTKFTNELYKHSKYVEEIPQEQFLSWAIPHYETFFKAMHSTILQNETQYLVTNIQNLQFDFKEEEIGSFSFSFVLQKATNEQLSKEENVRNAFLGFAQAFSDEE